MGQYFMPVNVIYGENCIYKYRAFLNLGGKAFIVTGRSSSKNGSLNDIMAALDTLGISYNIFNDTEENPSVECVEKAAGIGRNMGCDFVIALGGGSPLDAGKAVAVLLKNPNKTGYDLYSEEKLDAVPLIAVPTTAGTGSEVTAVFVLTNHSMKTKASTPQRVFPKTAFLDGKYLKGMPYDIMVNTVIDSLAHSIESFLCPSSSFFSEKAAEGAIEEFGKVKYALIDGEFTDKNLTQFLLISTLSGIALSQTGTSLPHYLGYALTYNKKIPHGRACGVLLYEYMSSFKNTDRVNVIVSKLGFSRLSDFGYFLDKILSVSESITEEELKQYAAAAISKPEKLKTFPEGATLDLLEKIYVNSINRFKEKSNV